MRLHYRPWTTAPRRPAAAIWPIARSALGQLLRRRLFWMLYACSLLLFLMFFFGSLMLDWAQGQLGGEAVQLGKLKIQPHQAMEFIRGQMRILSGTRETFAYFFGYQGAMTVVILVFSGAVLVGNDFAHRAAPFYLAKPIRGWHYAAGKFVASGAVILLIALLPALVLYAQQAFSDWNYALDVDHFKGTGGPGPAGPAGWRLLVGVLAYGFLLTGILGLFVVASAAWLPRTMPLLLGWSAVFLFLRGLSQALVDGLKYDARWRLLDLWNSLCLLGQACLGFGHDEISPKPQPTFGEAALVLGLGCAACLIGLRRRLATLEIVRSN